MDSRDHIPTYEQELKLFLCAFALLWSGWSSIATPTGYSIGLNLNSNEPNAPGELGAGDRAGVTDVKQRNWNNLPNGSGENAEPIRADQNDNAVNTDVTVQWTSNGPFSNTGHGEENNGFPTGPDRVLMTGYLDTGNATTTRVTVRNIPAALTGEGYDLYVYMLGGVAGRGGGYRVVDADSGAVIRDYKMGDSPSNPSSFIEDQGFSHSDTGNYLVFRSLTAANITVEATTENGLGFGGTPRAPLNAIQLVESAGLLTISGAVGSPIGFTVTVEDSVTRTLNPNNVTLTLDGTVVPTANVTVSKSGNKNLITFANVGSPLAAGSTHTVAITAGDNIGGTVNGSLSFTVPNYASIPAGYAAGAANTAEPGFNIRTVQLPSGVSMANNTQDAELMLAGRFIDPTTGQPAQNVASATLPEPEVINYSINAPLSAGNFNAENGHTDEPVPGIPGTTGEDLNFAQEITTYLDLKAGAYTMGVNSDDGFKVTTAPAAQDVLGITLGEFSGSRGAADTTFHFVVPQDGRYGFRLIWQQGTGEGSVEWFTTVNGERILLNDTKTGAVKAYRSTSGGTRPFVRAVSPVQGSAPVGVNTPVTFEIQNGTVALDVGSLALKVNGQSQTLTSVNTAGGVTTATYSPAGGFGSAVPYTVELTYSDSGTPVLTRTARLNFTTERVPNMLPPLLEANGLVVIETENFDALHGPRNGKTWTFGNSVPGFAGEGYMQSTPDVDSGTPNEPSTIPTTSPQLDYKVHFTQPGTYYVWVRGWRPSGGSDSLHVGFNNVAEESSIRITGFVETFGWHRARQTPSTGEPFVTVPSAGVHTVNLWMREDGTVADRILLTRNASFIPTEPGPPENLRVGQVPPTVSIMAPSAGATFAAGANINLEANAAVTGGHSITKVEFFANGVKVGEAVGGASTFSWQNVPEGRYRLTARATTSQNVTTTSDAINIVVGNPPDRVLFVTGSGGANASDQAIVDHLRSFGMEVTVVTGPNSKTSDALDKELVLISATVGSGDVNINFRDVAVPVINWEQALQDDLLLTDNIDGTTRGIAGAQTQIEIVAPAHRMAGGLVSGVHTIANNPTDYAFGVPVAGGTVVAQTADGTARPVIYGYDAGATLFNGTSAPARRAHVFLTDNTYLLLNDTGRRLVDAGVSWALNKDLVPAAPRISLSRDGNQLTISWTGGGALEASGAVTGENWTEVDTQSPYSTGTAGEPRFFRVRRP